MGRYIRALAISGVVVGSGALLTFAVPSAPPASSAIIAGSNAHQRAPCDVALDFVFAQTEPAKHRAVTFALEGRVAERLEFFAREAPRTARQVVGSAFAVKC
jgi:hypothetical protein